MFFFESRKTKFFFLPFVCHLPFAKKRERKKNKKREATKIKNLGRKKPPLKIRDDDDDDDDDSIRDATRPRRFPLLESNAPTNDDDDDEGDDRDHARGVVRHDRARVAV